MKVTPVDAEVVAGAVEDVLVARADGQDVGGGSLVAGEEDLLAVVAGGDVGIGGEIDADGVGLAVERTSGPGDVGDGAAEQIGVVEEAGGKEAEVKLDGAVAEAIAGVGGGDLHGELVERRHGAGIEAHDAIGLAVDADEARELLGMAGPVTGGRVGELIGVRPDGEVGVVGDEGRAGRALVGLGEDRGRGEGEDGERGGCAEGALRSGSCRGGKGCRNCFEGDAGHGI